MSDWEPVEEANMTIHYLENHIKMSPERHFFWSLAVFPALAIQFCPRVSNI